ncbi:hypothetical protein [Lysobacter sp.]|uniref:hypothetical protein n=1 Tax=Lysobacter sp. TaxID=72226 RepID=UPI002D70B880|nr:hypothetical protein [Lysobacter sp.]HZX78275.1 hypothetical protein [Lysobacter sp.]
MKPSTFRLAALACLLCVAIAPASATGRIDWILGPPGGEGNLDGTGTAVRFTRKLVLAADPYRGGLLVAEPYAYTIRRVSADGRVTTLAGRSGERGHRDGPATQALFHDPRGLAADSTGNVFVADGHHNVIRRIAPNGEVTTLAGAPGEQGFADGRGGTARFNSPRALAMDARGRLWVADTYNQAIRTVTSDGRVETLRLRLKDGVELAASDESYAMSAPPAMPVGAPSSDADDAALAAVQADAALAAGGDAPSAEDSDERDVTSLIGAPRAIAAAADAAMYLATDTALWRVVDGSAEPMLTLPARTAEGDEVEALAGISPTGDGTVYLTVENGGVVLALHRDGRLVRVHARDDESNDDARSIVVGPDGLIYLADFDRILGLDRSGRIPELIGHGTDETAAEKESRAGGGFESVAQAPDGSIYIARRLDNTVIRLDRDGNLLAKIGEPGVEGIDDGPLQRARLTYPADLAFDAAGRLYIADGDSGRIRRLDAQGRTLETFAGQESDRARRDGPLATATFWKPQRLAFDRTGNMYVLDTSPYVAGTREAVVRRIGYDGQVSTVATHEEAIRAAIRLAEQNPEQSILPDGFIDVAVGPADELLVLDGSGVVWELRDDGLHARVLPVPQPLEAYRAYLDGLERTDNGNLLIRCAFLFCGPGRLDAGPDGTLYISDDSNHTIMRIGSDGRPSVLGGTLGLRGNGPAGPLPSTLDLPNGMAVVGAGRLLFVTEHGGVGVIQEK